MNPLLKKVKDINTEACVSIILNTHRTKPDNLRDPINLKNLIKNAEARLLSDYPKRFAEPILKNIQNLTEQIDHNYNLESLVIYANVDFADFTRLPIPVENRVVIDDTFATRDLVRAMHQESAYYILVLSRQQARLIEAYCDSVVEEVGQPFPIENPLYTTDKVKLTTQQGQDNLIEEFFNRVDKVLWETTKNHSLPVLLATETRNVDHYLKVTDKKDLVIGHINRNRDDEKPHHIVPDAWKVVLEITKENIARRAAELGKAISADQLLTDPQEIWDAIQHGRGKTLFVRRGFFQPALLVDNEIMLVEKFERNQKGVVDDIVDEMIEQTRAFGGDTVFLDGEAPTNFENLALITRY